MCKQLFLLDEHDHSRLRDLAMHTESGVKRGELVRRMIRHGLLFADVVFDNLEPVPLEGKRKKLCVVLAPDDKAALRALASMLHLSMVDVVRCLIFHHWWTHYEYQMLLPGGRLDAFAYCLSWAPDRAQPWYSFDRERRELMEANSRSDRDITRRILAKNNVPQAMVEQIESAWDLATTDRKAFDNFYSDTPAVLRQGERVEKEKRTGFWGPLKRKSNAKRKIREPEVDR